MRMHQVSVDALDGEIAITQQDGDDFNTVVITVDQAELVAQWVKRCRDEIESASDGR